MVRPFDPINDTYATPPQYDTLVKLYPKEEGEDLDDWCRRLIGALEWEYRSDLLPAFYREAIWQVCGYVRRLEDGLREKDEQRKNAPDTRDADP